MTTKITCPYCPPNTNADFVKIDSNGYRLFDCGQHVFRYDYKPDAVKATHRCADCGYENETTRIACINCDQVLANSATDWHEYDARMAGVVAQDLMMKISPFEQQATDPKLAWAAAFIRGARWKHEMFQGQRDAFVAGFDARDEEIQALELALATQGVDYGAENKRLLEANAKLTEALIQAEKDFRSVSQTFAVLNNNLESDYYETRAEECVDALKDTGR